LQDLLAKLSLLIDSDSDLFQRLAVCCRIFDKCLLKDSGSMQRLPHAAV